MFDEELWESDQDEESVWHGRAVSSVGGADESAAAMSLESVMDAWIGAAGSAAGARLRVREDIGRLKGQMACRRRLIEMMQEQKFLQQSLDDVFADE